MRASTAGEIVASSIVIETYGILAQPEGGDMLHIITQGSPSSLEDFFLTPDLIGHVKREALKHPGLLQLANPVAHRMMMDEGKDAITGLASRANMNFMHGRPTQDDETQFAAYREQNHDGTSLHDQVGRLVLMVVSPTVIDRLADVRYVARLRVRHSGYLPRRERLHDFAREWQRLQACKLCLLSSAAQPLTKSGKSRCGHH